MVNKFEFTNRALTGFLTTVVLSSLIACAGQAPSGNSVIGDTSQKALHTVGLAQGLRSEPKPTPPPQGQPRDQLQDIFLFQSESKLPKLLNDIAEDIAYDLCKKASLTLRSTTVKVVGEHVVAATAKKPRHILYQVQAEYTCRGAFPRYQGDRQPVGGTSSPTRNPGVSN